MKIVPYLRFLWAFYILKGLISKASLLRDMHALLVILPVLIIVMVLTFVLYCIITGIQEMKDKKFVDARFFYSFGIVFELLIMLTGFLFMYDMLAMRFDWWNWLQLIFWQVALSLILFVDLRRALTIRE